MAVSNPAIGNGFLHTLIQHQVSSALQEEMLFYVALKIMLLIQQRSEIRIDAGGNPTSHGKTSGL